MKPKKILYGICGIGNGYVNRQLPIIEHYAKEAELMIFAYDESLKVLNSKFKDFANVKIAEVAVPFYVGNKIGLNFEATLTNSINKNKDFFTINTRALSQAQKFIGKPDVVISDYEPVCAQYAYSYKASLITIDQQSKYLLGDFSQELGGATYADEVARLIMFFPIATRRVACSFFNVPFKKYPETPVTIVAPILKESILSMKRKPSTRRKSILVYFSSQKEINQPIEEVLAILSEQKDCDFHIFLKERINEEINLRLKYKNIKLYKHGAKSFPNILANCNGIISTAGHSLLSEAMYLNIPVYAMPLDLYEQQMNAYVISKNKFGVQALAVDAGLLNEFIPKLDIFENNIKHDTNILLRKASLETFLELIEETIN